MTQALIGITTNPRFPKGDLSYDRLAHTYVESVLAAGGVPVLLPNKLQEAELPALRERLDGILLSGGGDIEPGRFKGTPSPTIGDISEERDELEFGLVRMSVATDWPLLGICRGMQVIDVALGGTLYTDLPTQYDSTIEHNTPDEKGRDYCSHEVTIKPGTVLAEILKSTRLAVNSFHHQGIKQVPPGLRVNATAGDGLVEGVEMVGKRFFIGVQWHPECLPQQAEAKALFTAFIRAAQSH